MSKHIAHDPSIPAVHIRIERTWSCHTHIHMMFVSRCSISEAFECVLQAVQQKKNKTKNSMFSANTARRTQTIQRDDVQSLLVAICQAPLPMLPHSGHRCEYADMNGLHTAWPCKTKEAGMLPKCPNASKNQIRTVVAAAGPHIPPMLCTKVCESVCASEVQNFQHTVWIKRCIQSWKP